MSLTDSKISGIWNWIKKSKLSTCPETTQCFEQDNCEGHRLEIALTIVDYVIIHQNKDIGIEYFLKRVLNFDFLTRDIKAFIPFECNP